MRESVCPDFLKNTAFIPSVMGSHEEVLKLS